jgi:hypothetical protein
MVKQYLKKSEKKSFKNMEQVSLVYGKIKKLEIWNWYRLGYSTEREIVRKIFFHYLELNPLGVILSGQKFRFLSKTT